MYKRDKKRDWYTHMIRKNFFILIVAILLISGCGSDTNTKSQTSSETHNNDTKKEEHQNKNGLDNVDPVNLLHTTFQTNIDKYFPECHISDIEKSTSGNSTFSTFELKKDGENTVAEFTTQNESSNFKISMPSSVSNVALIDFIKCAILSTNQNITLEDSVELTQELINSFDGSNMSSIISNKEYVFYIIPEAGLSQRYLYAVDINNINPKVDTNAYTEATSGLFKGELNQGSKVFISGKIINNVNLGTSWGLEISNDSGIYVVYYDLSTFPNVFSVGDSGTFYGTIAEFRNGYAGCLRLDYFLKSSINQ